MNIRKFAVALAFVATGVAFAGDAPQYLYWMVDLDQAAKNPYGVEGFTYATVSDDGGASYLNFYNTAGEPVGTGMAGSTDSTKLAGPLYAGLGMSLADSYLFELWQEDDMGDATRVGWASYASAELLSNIYTSREQGGNTPLTISVVPEPSGALLFLIGAACLALCRRRVALAACVSVLFSTGVFAAADNLVYAFQPDANDAYADGTPVLLGERYALVWLSNGSDGVEIAADCTVIDSTKGEIVKVRHSDLEEKGEEFTFQVDAARKDALVAKGGKWAVYLLDTRVYGSDGSVTLAAVVDGKATAVNAVKKLDKSVVLTSKLGNGMNKTFETDSDCAEVVTAVPADTPDPQITGLEIVDGEVHVKVSRTVPFLQYNLAAGETVDAVGGKKASAPKNGVRGGEIELVAPAESGSGFFRVNRN